jgi:hypothetical protein
MSDERDAEITTIGEVCKMLLPFDMNARERILNYAISWARDYSTQRPSGEPLVPTPEAARRFGKAAIVGAP